MENTPHKADATKAKMRKLRDCKVDMGNREQWGFDLCVLKNSLKCPHRTFIYLQQIPEHK